SAQARLLSVAAGGRFEKIGDRLLDAVAPVSVGDKIDVGRAMLEYATLQNFRLRTLPLREQLPLSAAGKESLYARGSTPVEVAVRILAVAELCRNGDDALVHVVGQGYEHVDSPWRDLGVQGGNGGDTAQQGHGDPSGNDRTRHSEVRPRKAAECSVPFTHQKQCCQAA